jgi:hypothetical protein
VPVEVHCQSYKTFLVNMQRMPAINERLLGRFLLTEKIDEGNMGMFLLYLAGAIQRNLITFRGCISWHGLAFV